MSLSTQEIKAIIIDEMNNNNKNKKLGRRYNKH